MLTDAVGNSRDHRYTREKTSGTPAGAVRCGAGGHARTAAHASSSVRGAGDIGGAVRASGKSGETVVLFGNSRKTNAIERSKRTPEGRLGEGQEQLDAEEDEHRENHHPGEVRWAALRTRGSTDADKGDGHSG